MNIVRSLLLIVKLVVEALDIARAHILSVQLLDLKKEFMSRMGEEFICEDKIEKKLTTRLASRAVSKTALAEPSGLPSLPMLMITCVKLEIELICSTFKVSRWQSQGNLPQQDPRPLSANLRSPAL